MDLNLSGRHAVVCGSTRGIGRASALELAALGAGVTLVGRDENALRAVLAQLPTTNDAQRHDVCALDTSDADSVRNGAQRIVAQGRPAHILVNNTGGPPGGRAIDAEPGAYISAFTNHLIAAQILAGALVPGMRTAKYGRIINIISTSVKQPIPGLGVSNTVRGAVASWAKTLSMELAPDNITVNNVLPGFTETDRLASLIGAKAKAGARTEQDVADEMRRSVPMGRFASAEEVAAAVAFLASPAASYISGVSLPVDGARTSAL